MIVDSLYAVMSHKLFLKENASKTQDIGIYFYGDKKWQSLMLGTSIESVLHQCW